MYFYSFFNMRYILLDFGTKIQTRLMKNKILNLNFSAKNCKLQQALNRYSAFY